MDTESPANRHVRAGLEHRYPSLGGSRVQIPPPPLTERKTADYQRFFLLLKRLSPPRRLRPDWRPQPRRSRPKRLKPSKCTRQANVRRTALSASSAIPRPSLALWLASGGGSCWERREPLASRDGLEQVRPQE